MVYGVVYGVVWSERATLISMPHGYKNDNIHTYIHT